MGGAALDAEKGLGKSGGVGAVLAGSLGVVQPLCDLREQEMRGERVLVFGAEHLLCERQRFRSSGLGGLEMRGEQVNFGECQEAQSCIAAGEVGIAKRKEGAFASGAGGFVASLMGMEKRRDVQNPGSDHGFPGGIFGSHLLAVSER